MRVTRSWKSLSVVGLGTAVIAAGAGGGITLATAHPAAMPTAVLRGDVLPGLAKATNLGHAADSTHVEVGIVLARPQAAEENALQGAMYTKGSADYHQFLTPAEFEARFAVPASTYRTVTQWAVRDGLSVDRTSAMRDYLTVSGTAKQAERTFAVTLDSYRQQDTHFYANTAAPTVPAALGVTGVIGLNSKLKSTLPATTPAKTKSGLAANGRNATSVHPDQDGCTGPACDGLTTPQDLWSVYDEPTNNYGQGQSMAIFGEGQTAPVVSNLREFESLHKLPEMPIKVVETDGSKADYSDNTGEVEWDLDTQSSTGMSPEANGETLYFGSSLSDASVLDDFEAWAEDPNGPLQGSASFGECEENPAGNATNSATETSAGIQYTEASEATYQQAVMEGRTVFASSGDTGSSCPVVPVDVNGVGNEGFPVVNYPASSPNVVAVGGTVLYTDGTGATQTGLFPSGASRVDEYSWNYTGGGSSVTFPEPDYQTKYAAPTPVGDCVEAPDGSAVTPGSVPCRSVPDIAAQSGDVASNGYGIVSQGETNYPGGGTSLSSPLSLGMWTRINAAAPAKSSGASATYPGLGFADETYYKDYKANPTDFFDIGGISGQTTVNSNGYYSSGPGDDYLSGLGVPDVAKIATHVDGRTAPANLGTPVTTSPGPALNPCSPTLFTDSPGDDSYPAGTMTGNNPQLDILSGDMAVSGTTLTTTLTINDLTTSQASPGGAANLYYFLWTFNGTQYFSEVQVDTTTGDVTYADGTVSGTTFTTNNTTDTGSFTMGKNGTVVVNVPLANIGSPKTGDVLTAPAGQTRVLAGTTATGGLIEQADTGGPTYDFELGQVCDPSSPVPTPSTPVTVVSPTPISTTTASPTPTPTTTSKSGDHTKPGVHIVRTHKRPHHKRYAVILITDGGTGIGEIADIHKSHNHWTLGGHGGRKTFSSHPHTVRIRVYPTSHRSNGTVSFVVYDAARNHRSVHYTVTRLK